MSRALLRPAFEGMEEKRCAHCGRTFYRDRRNTWSQWERTRFCSRECVGKVHSQKATAARPTLRDAFNRWVVKTETCWQWAGATDKDGYGVFGYARKMYRAPKVALMLDGRPVPDGQYACHHCDNPACVRPDHLYPGTPSDNVQDMFSRGRAALGERKRSSKLTDDIVRTIRASTETDAVLGARYGVTPSNISMVRSRRTWKHVA